MSLAIQVRLDVSEEGQDALKMSVTVETESDKFSYDSFRPRSHVKANLDHVMYSITQELKRQLGLREYNAKH